MRRNILAISLILIVMSGICSCKSNDYKFKLEKAESIITDKPDSALSILESISKSNLKSPKLKAKYSLLYATALDKNYIDTTDLGVLADADRYYSRFGSPEEKMKTNYYKGVIYHNQKNDIQALYHYQKALEDSSNISDHYKGLINSSIATTFRKNYNSELELQYIKAALNYSKLAKDSAGVWINTAQLASAQASVEMFEDSDKTYKEFFSMPIIDSLPYYIHRKNYAKQILLQASGRDQEANEILEDVIREMPEIMDIDAYCVYALAQHRIGNDTVAYDIMRQLEDISPNTDNIKYWRYILYSETGEYEQALKDLEHSVIHQNSVILTQLR